MDKRLNKLYILIRKVYVKKSKKLLFHGWHHVNFVFKKSLEFAKETGASANIVGAAALTHDLNYMVKVYSPATLGDQLRDKYLSACDYSKSDIVKINTIISNCETSKRSKKMSAEEKALSDADTLFKALPITPILFGSKYITENNIDINKLANEIVRYQKPLFEKDIYFYTKLAKRKYLGWAKINLLLWNNVQESLKDSSVQQVLKDAKSLGVI